MPRRQRATCATGLVANGFFDLTAAGQPPHNMDVYTVSGAAQGVLQDALPFDADDQ
jgi:hypothetical protein